MNLVMDYNETEIISPFGPKILVSQCPSKVVSCLNDYTENVSKNKIFKDKYSSFGSNRIPDLLSRSLETIFLSQEKTIEMGIDVYLENVGNEYLRKNNSFDSGFTSKLGIKKINTELVSDCWINRYFGKDYTPLHLHEMKLSGVIFLKVPNFLSEKNLSESSSGKIFFIFGDRKEFCDDMWTTKQEVGKILVFPSWLRHVVYPTNVEEERRTFSFNLDIVSTKSKKHNESKVFYH